MNTLQISSTNDNFIRNGRPFFYLADTVWSALTNASLEEWEYYLNYRLLIGTM